jgi:hypothetical protein
MSKRRLRKIKWLAQRSMNWKLVAFIFEFRSDQSKVQNLQYLLASIFISLFFPLVSFNLEPYLSYVAFYDFAFCFMSTGQFAVAHPSVWSYLIFCPTSPLWSHSGWVYWARIPVVHSALGRDLSCAFWAGMPWELLDPSQSLLSGGLVLTLSWYWDVYIHHSSLGSCCFQVSVLLLHRRCFSLFVAKNIS